MWSVSGSGVSQSLWTHRLQPTRLLCPWSSPGKNTGVGSIPSPGDLPDPRMETNSALQADSLPSEPPGKLYKAGNAKQLKLRVSAGELSGNSPEAGKSSHGAMQAGWGLQLCGAWHLVRSSPLSLEGPSQAALFFFFLISSFLFIHASLVLSS